MDMVNGIEFTVEKCLDGTIVVLNAVVIVKIDWYWFGKSTFLFF